MLTQMPPCLFYFPLKIMLVDDNVDYLALCKNKIRVNPIEISNKPLELINGLDYLNIDIKSFIKEFIDNEFSVDYSAIDSFVKKYINLNKTGILITDYDMPEINGLELCSKFEQTNLIKILLTAEYNITDAMEAVNSKQIDYYLPKGSNEKLLKAIDTVQLKFFQQISKSICQMTGAENMPFLIDDNYINIFNKIIKDNNITTYFILNSFGCYYLANATNKYVLSIYSNSDLEELSDELSINNLKSRQQIPSCKSILTDNVEFLTCSQYGDYFYHLENVAK